MKLLWLGVLFCIVSCNKNTSVDGTWIVDSKLSRSTPEYIAKINENPMNEMGLQINEALLKKFIINQGKYRYLTADCTINEINAPKGVSCEDLNDNSKKFYMNLKFAKNTLIFNAQDDMPLVYSKVGSTDKKQPVSVPVISQNRSVKPAETPIPETFSCESLAKKYKSDNSNIIAIENIRKVDSSKNSDKFWTFEKVPGTILGRCIGDIYFKEGKNGLYAITNYIVDGMTKYVGVQSLADQADSVRDLEKLSDLNEKLLEERKNDNVANNVQTTPSNVKDENVATPKVDSSITNQISRPSFDCNKASNFVEKTICNEVDLSKLDVKLDKLYKDALSVYPKPQLKSEQIAWIKVRNLCLDKVCIESAYKSRIDKVNEHILSGEPDIN